MKIVKFSVNEDLDRISELPEDIILYILLLLPIKDAGRTCILSKTWKSLCSSYNILPYLHLDHNSFALQLLLSTESRQQEPEIYEIRDRFMDYADSQLLKVIKQQTPVLELALDVAVIGSEFDRVDRCMELVRNMKVEELSVFVQTQDFRMYDAMFEGNLYYEFPYSLIQTKWLQCLIIQGCKFSGPLLVPGNNLINNNAGIFSSLRELWLLQVKFLSEEALSNVASCCPEIELIDFDCCSFGFTTLKLSKFPKLKKASLEGDEYGLVYVDITETNLESFRFIGGGSMEGLITPATCNNIRKLLLWYCCLTEHNLLNDLATTFPLLEKADLEEVVDMEPFEGLDRITASNLHMRKLRLVSHTFIRVLSLECPNLRHFRYIGKGFKEVYMNCPKLQEFHYYGSIPKLMFLNDLATTFPLLEKAELQDDEDVEPFEGLDRITASNLHMSKLELIFYTRNTFIRVLSLECPNLRHFRYIGKGFKEVYLNCPKLQEFHYYGSFPKLMFLNDLATTFPLLEKADLQDDEDVEPFEGLDRITASNLHMRELKLIFNTFIRVLSLECPNLRHFEYIGKGFEEVYLNCPELRKFRYRGSFPKLILLDLPTDVEYISFEYYVMGVLNTSWFISVNKFLEQIRGGNDVYVYLKFSTNMVEFVLDEFGAVQTSQPNCVHLQVEIAKRPVDMNISAALVDGLIWSTRPATLSLAGDCCDFVKHLCDKLAEVSRDRYCCDQQLCSKYWWHNISNFEVKYKDEDMKQNLASLVETCKQSGRGLSSWLRHIDRMPILFKFEWHSNNGSIQPQSF